LNWRSTGLFGLFLASCTPSVPADSFVISSDPELRALAAELLPDLAERSGLALHRPVRLERRTREEILRYVTAKLDEDLSPEREDLLLRSYFLLGLVPEGLDLRGILLSVYSEQVAGFYDPDSAALFVLDDQSTESLRTVLLHELVHAVQDQAADLESVTSPERGNDRQTAAQAAIEGHATLVMLEYMMEQLQGSPVDLSNLEAFSDQLRPALDVVREQYPALGRAPRIIQESLLFPYLEGAGFVQKLWRTQGSRVPPFGEFLPLSTEQILHPERLVGLDRDDPIGLDLQFSGTRVLHTDVLGQLEVGLLLEELSGISGLAAAAVGWGGDRYALLDTPDGDAMVWVSVWDDEASRARFAAALEPVLARLPRTSVLDAVSIDGVPGLVLRVGDVGAVEVALARGSSGSAIAGEGSGP